MTQTAVTFADDLYGGSAVLAHLGGAGLLGFCGSWGYARHDNYCKPGRWLVFVVAQEAGDFAPLVTNTADAVVDDFGNLAKVQS